MNFKKSRSNFMALLAIVFIINIFSSFKSFFINCSSIYTKYEQSQVTPYIDRSADDD